MSLAPALVPSFGGPGFAVTDPFAPSGAPAVDNIILETGDNILLETGDLILLE